MKFPFAHEHRFAVWHTCRVYPFPGSEDIPHTLVTYRCLTCGKSTQQEIAGHHSIEKGTDSLPAAKDGTKAGE